MSPIPGHCPYKAGDRVQMHGYSGYHVHHGQHLSDHAVTGFRGVVEGHVGGTILTGTTDGGRPWTECWGHLDPELTPCHDNRCGCCPHSGRMAVNGRVRSGHCQPEQASAERAQAAARDHAEWLRQGCPPRRHATPVIEQLGLFGGGV